MELLFASIIFLIGLGILFSGAEVFIHYSSQLGIKLGISDVVIGITLVALGTSIPEIFVSISSIINDAPAIALGNSIGSNISNIAIIYGISLFWLASKTLDISLRNIFILILSVLIAGWALYDLTISIGDSIVFIALFVLFVLNLVVINRSKNINSQQLLVDLRPIIDLTESEIFVTYVLISLSVSLITLFLIKIFQPFIEIYLLYYLRFSFYILINLLSLSSVYLVLRVYGYSRFFVILYLIGSSTFLLFSDRLKN